MYNIVISFLRDFYMDTLRSVTYYTSLSDEQLLIKHGEAERSYRQGNPVISDYEFDHMLMPVIRSRFHKDHPIFTTVGAEPEGMFNTGSKVEHRDMLSIDNFFEDGDILDFFKRFRKIEDEIGEPAVFRVNTKLDGMSGLDENGVIATRGNKSAGEDVTKLINYGVIPIGGRNLGAGEFVVNKKYFYENLLGRYTTMRSFVVGLASSLVLNEFQLRALDAGAVVFYPYSQLPFKDISINEFIARRSELEKIFVDDFEYPADGLVADCINEKYKSLLGSNSKYNRWQGAIKRNDETAIVTVIDVQADTGRTGNVVPRAFFDSVLLSEGNLSVATGHNLKNFYDKGLGKGAVIEIVRSGKIIPYIRNVITPSATPYMIHDCPVCSHPLDFSTDVAQCLNEDCGARKNKKIIYFFDNIKYSEGIGKETVTKLISSGFDSVVKILNLSHSDMMALGFGAKASVNFEKALLKILTNPIPLDNFLYSLGIPLLGKETAYDLSKYFTLDKILNISDGELIKLNKFGLVKSVTISLGIEDMKADIMDILNSGMQIDENTGKIDSSVLNGYNIVFTGELPVKRSLLEKQLKELGGKSGSTVSKNTSFVVIGDNPGDAKTNSAKVHNKRMISYDEYLSFLDDNGIKGL
jgi:DNA ligase (NAD+)